MASVATLKSNLRSIVASIRRADRPVRRFNSLVLKRTGLCRLFVISQPGFRLRFYPSAISTSLWYDPQARQNDVALIQRALPPGGTYVDVGANIGQLVLAAAQRVGPTGRVIAIEPHPRVYGFLERNVALNPELAPIIESHHLAVGEDDGMTILSASHSDDLNRVGEARGIAVALRRLDSLLAGIPYIDLLKVDVEGYELYVLRGALTILPSVSVVLFEYCQAFFTSFGYTGVDVLDLLDAMGFAVFQVRDGILSRVERNQPPTDLQNLLALRNVDAFLRQTGYRMA